MKPEHPAKTPVAPSDNPRKTLRKDVLRILGVLLVFGLIGWVLSLPAVREEYLDASRLRDSLQDTGFRGLVYFLILGGLLTGVGIPRLWISAIAGWLYGAAWGTLVALGASLLGATIAFLAGRWLLRGPVKRRMPRRFLPWYERFNTNGFRYMLIMRLFPFSVAILTSIVGGVSRMGYPAFLAATTIGYLPLTIVFALFGKGATGEGFAQLAMGAVFMVVVLAGERHLRRALEPSLPPEPDEPEEGTVDVEEMESADIPPPPR